MTLNKKGDGIRFRYHAPVPNFYKIKNPENPLKTISNDLLNEFEEEVLKKGFRRLCYSTLDEEDYSKFQNDCKNVIILKFPITPSILEMEPSREKYKCMDDEFQDVAKSLFDLCDYLRNHGFSCELVNPLADDMSLRALAIKSNEAVITRSNMCLFDDGLTMCIFAIACSIENLPFKKSNELLWVRDYCSMCGKCIEVCPYGAYDENEQLIPRKCRAHNDGCSECMTICPFFKKDINTVKLKYKLKINKLAERGLL